MARVPLERIVQHLQSVTHTGVAPGQTDGQLVTRYLAGRDEGAFATLVRRHGPMVFSVCQRVLGNAHDAEDAFQATFLVFVRRAASLARPELLGNWLHGVAFRTALEAKAAVARRRVKEKEKAELARGHPGDEDAGRDVREVLDEELSRLPARLRAVVLLCDLESRTRKEVAQALGLPEGTVSSRLARGRALLARRLTRRGMALSGLGLAAGLIEGSASAGVTVPLAASTLWAGNQQKMSRQAVALAEGVTRAMAMTRIKRLTAVLLLGTLVLGSTVLAFRHFAQGAAKAHAVQADPTGGPVPVADKPKEAEPADDLARLQGRWRLVSLEPTEAGPHKEIVWEIKDKTIHVLLDGVEMLQCEFTIDEKGDPKRIDIVIPQDGGKKKTSLGIYKIEEGKLTVCEARPERERPKEFKPGKDGPFPTVAVYKR